MRDPKLVARAGNAGARLEQAWERWRALHGLGGSSDPLASYVGYSHKEPMGQPRVVFGVDAAEAEHFADLLESHKCAGMAQTEPWPANGLAHPPIDGSVPAPRDVPSEPLARTVDTTGPDAMTVAASAECAALTGSGLSPGAAAMVFQAVPQGRPQDPSDPMAAELAGWASGELPGQASEQLASWAAAESPPSRAMDRPRSAR